jgi:hypothetical protein
MASEHLFSHFWIVFSQNQRIIYANFLRKTEILLVLCVLNWLASTNFHRNWFHIHSS